MLTTVFVNVGTASAFMIGNEDMPESIKKIRLITVSIIFNEDS